MIIYRIYICVCVYLETVTHSLKGELENCREIVGFDFHLIVVFHVRDETSQYEIRMNTFLNMLVAYKQGALT